MNGEVSFPGNPATLKPENMDVEPSFKPDTPQLPLPQMPVKSEKVDHDSSATASADEDQSASQHLFLEEKASNNPLSKVRLLLMQPLYLCMQQ